MALDKLTKLTSQSGITTTIDYQMSDLTVDTITVQSGGLKMPVGMSTFQNVTVTGDLTVNGTTTTLDTDLIGVDKLEVSGNNTTAVGIITQAGSGDILRLYDNTTQVFTVQDGGKLLLGTTTAGAAQCDTFTLETSGHTGVTLFSGTSNRGTIAFGDGRSGNAQYRGVIMYDHSDDNMNFVTSDAEKLRITSDGKVGIGLTDPATLLEVSAGTNKNLNVWSSGAYATGITIGSANDAFSAYTPIEFRGSEFYFHNGTAEKVRIDSAGRVGINTTTLTEQLEVDGDIRVRNAIKFREDNGTETGNISLTDDDNLTIQSFGTSGHITFDTGSSATERLQIDANGNVYVGGVGGSATAGSLWLNDTSANASKIWQDNGNSALVFGTGSGQNERLRIHSNGNVGIGTATDSASRLTLYGSAAVITQNSNTGSGSGNGFYMGNGNGTIAYIWNYENESLRFATDNKERIRITADGKIGINTTGANNGPSAPVHIYGNSDTTPILAFTRSTTHDDWQGAGIGLDDEGGTYKGALTFYTHDSSGTKNDSVTEKMRITSGGFVQIGAAANAAEAPLHVTAENSQGINAIFGAKDFVVHDNYNYADANIALQGRDAGDNDTGAGIQFTTRTTSNNNWLHGAFTMGQDGHFKFLTGGAGTTVGTEKVRIHTDGQVTIGNDHSGAGTWTGQLVVATTTGGVITAGDTGSGEKLHLEGGSGLGRIGTTSNHDLVFVTNGTSNERLRILADGEVLVGGRNDWGGGNLHPNTVNKLVITGPSPDNTYNNILYLEGSETSGAVNTGGALAFGGHDGSQYRNWGNIYGMKENGTGGNVASYMSFHTREAGGAPAEKLRITSEGKVGTAATVRSAKGGLDLCAQGATNLGTLTLGASGGQNGINRNNNTENQFRIMMPSYANPANMVTVMYGASGSSLHEINYGGGTGWAYAANLHRFFTAANKTTGTGTERLGIDSGGRVIVGGGTHAGGGALVVKGTSNTPNAYGCAAFAKIGANPTSGTTLAQLRFSAGSGGTNRAAEIDVKADSNWNDGTNQESKMIFKVASNAGGNTAGNPLLTLKGNGTVEVNRGTLQLAHKLNCSSSEDTGTHITSISHSGNGAFDGGLVFQTRCYEEYHFKWTGQYDHTVVINGPSYFSAWVEYQFTQTNGGSDTMNHVRGKWANNHYTHTWDQEYASGGASALASGVPSFTATDQNGNATGSSTTANGRLTIFEDYQGSGLSMNNSVLILRVYYASNTMSISHTGS